MSDDADLAYLNSISLEFSVLCYTLVFCAVILLLCNSVTVLSAAEMQKLGSVKSYSATGTISPVLKHSMKE